MVIKSTSEEGMLSDIQETFERFRSINMKLNLKKCSFGVEEGLFLGYLITKQGIKSNLTKIKAVIELEQPRALKDIQSLNEKLAALSRFLSKGGKKIPPFLQAPRVGETLIMYLVISKESINIALFTKRSEEQIPIYFVSRMLQGAELNYPALEKLILALVHAARRLQRYFQAHTIMVPTGTPAKWAIELGEHDIIFLKRDEREMPADFLPEIPFDDSEKKVKEKEVSDPSNEWKLYTDGASSPDEYEALLAGLRIAQEMEITKVAIFLDSQLVVNQIKGTYAAKQFSIKSYLQKVLVKVLAKTSIEEKEVLKVEIEEKRSWMSPIQEYLLSGLLPEDTKEARKIRIQVPRYKLIRGNMYKRSFFTPWLRCIASLQTDKIIKEIHEGSCGFNVKPCLMVVRITKQGYYWTSMHGEAAKAIQDCDKCKEQSAIRKAGVDGAIAVGSMWPFSHWGIHILGPLPMAPGGL
ncbi:reverse transcriptase domain-containing protein [Tanacetum coccineum]